MMTWTVLEWVFGWVLITVLGILLGWSLIWIGRVRERKRINMIEKFRQWLGHPPKIESSSSSSYPRTRRQCFDEIEWLLEESWEHVRYALETYDDSLKRVFTQRQIVELSSKIADIRAKLLLLEVTLTSGGQPPRVDGASVERSLTRARQQLGVALNQAKEQELGVEGIEEAIIFVDTVRNLET